MKTLLPRITRTRLLVIAMFALAGAGCDRPRTAQTPVEEPAAEAVETAQPSAPETEPAALAMAEEEPTPDAEEPKAEEALAAEVKPAAPVPVTVATTRFAPEGIFFVLQPVSVPTQDGVFGIKPGTPVRQVGEGKYLAGDLEVELRPDQVTNEIRLAAQAFSADRAAQARMLTVLGADRAAAPDQPELLMQAPPPSSSAIAAAQAREGTATPEAPVEEVSRFAPDGVFFLLKASSVETRDGVVGLPPGTQVRKIGEGRYSASGHEFSLSPGELTNDMQLARSVSAAHEAAQARLKQRLEAGAAVERAAKAEALSSPEPGSSAGSTSSPPSSTNSGSGLGSGSRLQGSSLQGSSGLGGGSR